MAHPHYDTANAIVEGIGIYSRHDDVDEIAQLSKAVKALPYMAQRHVLSVYRDTKSTQVEMVVRDHVSADVAELVGYMFCERFGLCFHLDVLDVKGQDLAVIEGVMDESVFGGEEWTEEDLRIAQLEAEALRMTGHVR